MMGGGRIRREPSGPGQRSVWDFPRPPALEQWHERVEVLWAGRTVARTTEAWCVLETSHPPTYYLPQAAFEPGILRWVDDATWCEWKGRARYADLVVGDAVAPRAAWDYPGASGANAVLAGHVAVYAGLVDECRVDGEAVVPQAGGFYGGWITSRVTGPFKGGSGTAGW